MSYGNIMRLLNAALKEGESFDLAAAEILKILPVVDDQGSINVGDGTTDMDVKWFGGDTTHHVLMDVGNQRVQSTNVPLQFTFGTGAAAAASGLLIGGGTSAAPCLTSTADAKFVELRCKTTAATGDNRLGYFRYDIGGAAGGECLRAITDLTAATNNAHGAHISLQVDATGYVSGQGVGCRDQLYVQGIVPANGTYYAAQAEMYFDESATIAAVTKHAILSVQAAGNATAMATCLNAIAFDGTSAADATKMISSVSLAELPAGSVGIAVLINGTRYYIPAVAVAEWN